MSEIINLEKLMSEIIIISLLPILLKVTEKVVHEQTKFLNDNNIFYKYQNGCFTNNHSIDLFLSFLNDKIWKVLITEFILA